MLKNSLKSILVLGAGVALTACGGQAFAAEAVTGVNQNGVQATIGTGNALWVAKGTLNGSPALEITLVNTSTYRLVDNASGSLYARAVSQFGANAVVATGAPGSRVYDISKVGSVSCQASKSVISWPNIAMPETLDDGCAFFNAAKAAAQ